MDYLKMSNEQLISRINELELINRQLIENKDQEVKLDFPWTGNLGHWYWNMQTNTVTFNPLKVITLGYTTEDIPLHVAHQFFTDKLHPDDYANVMDNMTAHMQKKTDVYEVEYRIQTKEGGWKWFHDRGKITQYDKDGKPLFMAGIAFDITKRKTVEAQLKNQAEELIRKNQLITEIFTNISHDFKTPLSIILIQLELMKLHQHDEEKMNKLISTISQNIFCLSRLVGNVLDISRIDAGFIGARLECVDMISLLRNITDSVEPYANAKSIQLIFSTRLTRKLMPTDLEKIERIMFNLLSNAIKNTNKNGKIMVCVKNRKNGGLVILVKDNGEGIPQEKLKIIFDRFAQVDSLIKRRNEGSGIGLSLVKSLVDILEGQLSVESELGKGSTFKVELPLLKSGEVFDLIEVQGFSLSQKAEIELSDIF